MEDYELRLLMCFPGSFINTSGEFIACRESNTYFCLANCKDETEVKYKVIERLSRAAYKTEPFYREIDNNRFHAFISAGVNEFLGTSFGADEWKKIYTKLGNCCNRPLTERFVASGYDLNILEGL
ncbi:MAG TPA: hypothetical protein IAC67_06710 [Candidatus Coproplasma excrementipullorum]|nr:hypothetical protein [Candidatus Coproplasma excrementipullorum]